MTVTAPELEFSVLGPMRVRRADRELVIIGRKTRTLLALLLLHANRLVPVERLIDVLWPERPPISARNLVQGYASDVRRTLGADRPLGLQGGYQLRVAPGELDLHRFQQLVEQARGARASGQTSAAASHVRTALGMWSGQPLTGVCPGSLVAEVLSLEEARLDALELRIELDLELGHARAMAGELDSLVRAHPFREQLWRLLMLALYCAGRRADALRTYRELQAILLRELGVGPSAALRELREAILAESAKAISTTERNR